MIDQRTDENGISRVVRTKQQAISAYDRLSRWYDLLAAGSEQPLARLGLAMLNAGSGEKVLEIGSGTGQALLSLAVAVTEAGRVCGVDISHGMLKVAAERFAGINRLRGVWMVQTDASRLPFGASVFDAAFISFALELFDTPEIPLVLSECQRVLRPDGRICVVAMARDTQENIPQRVYEWFHSRMPAYVDCRPIFVRAAIAEAGFAIQQVSRRNMWGLPVEICLAQMPPR